mmetsp:Transcript_64561/g.114822  ORF Transcript_64561/g.114822 Transcript_64561/m.114822 type:complete len:538 (-) Transcript_64561:181-1794(-)
MVMLSDSLNPAVHPASKLMPNDRVAAMNCQPQQVYTLTNNGFVPAQSPTAAVPPAPGKWNLNMQAGTTGPAPMMGAFMMQLPEQAVMIGCPPSGDGRNPVLRPMAVLSTDSMPSMHSMSQQVTPPQSDGIHPALRPMGVMSTDSMPSMQSMQSMMVMSTDSLPILPKGNSAFAVHSMESLPPMRNYAVGSMDSLPDFTPDFLPEAGGRAFAVQSMDTLPTFAVGSMDSLPSMPANKPGARRRKRGGRKGLVKEPTVHEELVEDRQVVKLGNRKPEGMPGPYAPDASEQAAAPKEVKESIDPVILELEEGSVKTQRHTLEWITSSVWPLALTSRGSRILQKALEIGSASDQQMIINRLSGRIQEAMKSPHANYVLQKCIEVMAPERVQLILDELKGDAVMAARHRFGCRILQRLIEHCPLEQTDDLAGEVLSEVDSLCRHQFGNFVVQHILQHGSPEHKKRIADVLQADVIRLAKHRIASHVVSCALVHCAQEDVQRITQVVLEDAGQLADLSRREYGSFVVREVNRVRRMHAAGQQS